MAKRYEISEQVRRVEPHLPSRTMHRGGFPNNRRVLGDLS